MKRQPINLFTVVKKNSVLNLSPHSTPQRLPLGIPINIARKTAINISTRGKREKASLGPVTGCFANVPFVNVLQHRSAKKGNERCVYRACILGFVLSAMIQKKRYTCIYLVLLNIDQAKVVLETDPTRSETTSEVNPRASQFSSHCLPRVLFVAVSPSSSPEQPEVNKHMFNPQATQHHTIC